MASILEEVHAFLLTQTTLAALVGKRIYPGTLPQDCTLPAISCGVTNDSPIHTMGSDAGNPSKPLVSFDIWAKTYTSGKAVSTELRIALTDKSGTLTTRTIQRAFFENEYDLPEPDTGTHRIVVDFIIWYV